MERAYTLDEIDRMRNAVVTLMCLKYGPPEQRDNAAEIRLRTYMMAGITPEELETKAREFQSASAPVFNPPAGWTIPLR